MLEHALKKLKKGISGGDKVVLMLCSLKPQSAIKQIVHQKRKITVINTSEEKQGSPLTASSN